MEKLALIDLGSSRIDLTLAKYLPSGNFTVYEEMSEKLCLVDSTDSDAMLSPSKIKEALEVLKMYRTVCDVNKVSNIIAVVSSAIRNLKNYRSFLDEAYNECGFKFRLLSPEEETQALYTGVINSIDCPKGVIAHIGWGAVRLVQYNRRNILNQAVIPFGSYALSTLMEEGKDIQTSCKKMEEKFKTELDSIEWLKNIEPEFCFIGVGSAFNNASILSRKIKKYPLDNNHNYHLGKTDFDQAFDVVKSLEMDKSRKIKGLSNDNSFVITSGMAIVDCLLKNLPFDEVTVSTKGIKEGFILSSIMQNGAEKIVSDLLGVSLDNICAFYENDYSNAKQVCNLALILFKQLKVIHRLPRGYVKVLRIASAMHDSGKRMKFDQNEKNSFDIILNSDLLGVTHREIVLAAFVSRSQILSNFNPADWVKYKDILLDEDVDAVRKLAMIVKLAVALDKTHRNAVQDISCDILGDSVIMKTIVTVDASIEVREAIKSCSDFRKVYKKNLEVL